MTPADALRALGRLRHPVALLRALGPVGRATFVFVVWALLAGAWNSDALTTVLAMLLGLGSITVWDLRHGYGPGAR